MQTLGHPPTPTPSTAEKAAPAAPEAFVAPASAEPSCPTADEDASKEWWLDSDLMNTIASLLDGASIASFSQTCRFVSNSIRSTATLRWLAELRGLETANITRVEHIELAEAMAQLECSIAFDYGSLELEPHAIPRLGDIASLLARHTSLNLSIEAVCSRPPHPTRTLRPSCLRHRPAWHGRRLTGSRPRPLAALRPRGAAWLCEGVHAPPSRSGPPSLARICA